MSWHVYPLNDEREHITTGTECWCDPKIEWIDLETNLPYGDGPLVVHNAQDCREVVEEAERIKNSI